MSVRAFIEQLGSIGAGRMAELVDDGIVSDFYVMAGPDRTAGDANLAVWGDYPENLRKRMWAWYVATPHQAGDVLDITDIDIEVNPAGFCLNIEKPLEGADLSTLINGVKALGKPIVASLAGADPKHYLYDHRTLDKAGVEVEWQCYLDSGEGPPPSVAVRELYQTTQVGIGGQYRAQIKGAYGWGVITPPTYYSYNKKADYAIALEDDDVLWPPWKVLDRALWRHSEQHPAGEKVGNLLGLATYKQIRAALDTTRGHHAARTLPEWTALAASARFPGASKRGVSVYLLENCPDDVLRAIAAGA